MFSMRDCVLETVTRTQSVEHQKGWNSTNIQTLSVLSQQDRLKHQSLGSTRKLDFSISWHFWASNRIIQEMRTQSAVLTIVSRYHNGDIATQLGILDLDELCTGQDWSFSLLCYLLYHLSHVWINFKTAILGPLWYMKAKAASCQF